MENDPKEILKEGDEVTLEIENKQPQLVVVQWIYYMGQTEEIHTIQHSQTSDCKKYEQVYKRSLKATTEWQLLDCGWIKNPSLITIINNEKDTRHTLHLAFDDCDNDVLLVPPDTCQTLRPNRPKTVFIRSSMPSTQYTLHVFPE